MEVMENEGSLENCRSREEPVAEPSGGVAMIQTTDQRKPISFTFCGRYSSHGHMAYF